MRRRRASWELMVLAAVLAAGSAVWQMWRARPLTATACAVNGVTCAVLAAVLLLADMRRRP